MVEPSETERGQRWLSNFKAHEISAAKRLLDNLDCVGQDELRNGLILAVTRLAKRLKTPIALVPVRELDSHQSYYGVDRNATPRLLLSGSFPGSEAVVANIITNLRRRAGNKGDFVAAPSLANMREAQCRTVLLVDDYSGSGTRIENFLKSYRRHKPILSWQSYKLIDLHVITYVMTEFARNRLVRLLGDDAVQTARVGATFDEQAWETDELAEVIRLCQAHSEERKTSYPFGFLGTRGMTVFSHSVPNNIPYILRRKSSSTWNSFFEGNVVPNDILPLFSQPKRALRLEAALARMGQERLQTGHWRLRATSFLKEAVLVLAAVARGVSDEHAICRSTTLSADEVSSIVYNCRRWGLINKLSLHLTDQGRSELMHAKKIGLGEERFQLNPSNDFYYLQQLRVGR
ncbi:hypothetical protein [Mesorhizobium sp.]|uniref:phosphoribosyltransferase-like protein n=1 Tax=Mesorhizobium sp. TaxID=1871066 RepID=UPI000FE6D51E|nr:hypothetical protein [Mesorhizobium sp.]RWM22117.1 MAG: hypothetical protein EOR74_28060 [Mesorhizobium sp.]